MRTSMLASPSSSLLSRATATLSLSSDIRASPSASEHLLFRPASTCSQTRCFSAKLAWRDSICLSRGLVLSGTEQVSSWHLPSASAHRRCKSSTSDRKRDSLWLLCCSRRRIAACMLSRLSLSISTLFPACFSTARFSFSTNCCASSSAAVFATRSPDSSLPFSPSSSSTLICILASRFSSFSFSPVALSSFFLISFDIDATCARASSPLFEPFAATSSLSS
mmetsp:Transcript_36693/g.88708  ORF Transcript_36693/g.88708 Transcript_36693/m.88708 type:complete len:222 (-) Transcript_36693:504-1169(-)